ncbi:MAG: hypothetical protein Q8W44_11485 [Candidatus Palauibacterales bacterium]|nr:hypothetical protein [Candidatus Palauibacterales bacterium]
MSTAEGKAGGRAAARELLSDAGSGGGEETEPCLRCGVPLPVRLMGCKGGHCPNCGHPYPHGDCSD